MGTITLEVPAAQDEIEAGLHATNYADLQTLLNGNLDNANISASAALDATARVGVRKNSAGSTFSRRRINFIEGSGVTLTVADDSGGEEVDVTIAAGATAFSGAKVYRTTNQTMTGSATTVMVWDNEEFDTDTFHDNVTNNTRLTIPTSGKYLVTVNVELTGTGANVVDTIDVRLDGTTVLATKKLYDVAAAAGALDGQFSTVLDLTAAGYLEIRYTRAAAAAVTLIGTQDGCYVSVCKF